MFNWLFNKKKKKKKKKISINCSYLDEMDISEPVKTIIELMRKEPTRFFIYLFTHSGHEYILHDKGNKEINGMSVKLYLGTFMSNKDWLTTDEIKALYYTAKSIYDECNEHSRQKERQKIIDSYKRDVK